MDKLKNETANPEHEKFVQWNEQTKEKMNTIKKMAIKRFADVSFEKEFKPFFLLAITGKTICNIVSFFTMYIALNLVWGNWLGGFSSTILGLGTAIFLEGLKIVIFGLCFKYILKYKLISKVTLIPIITISAITISFSLVGAYYLPYLKAENQIKTIALNDIAKMKADTSNINSARNDALAFFVNTSKTKGTKTYISSTKKDAQKVYAEKSAILSTLVLAHQKQISDAINENKSIKDKNEILVTKAEKEISSKTKNERWIFVGIAAFMELIFFVLAFAAEFYLIWVGVDNIEDEKERELVKKEMSQKMQFSFAGQRPINLESTGENQEEIKPSIQFKQGEKETAVAMADKTAVAMAETVIIETVSKVEQTAVAMADKSAIATAVCKLKECETKFVKTVHNKEFCCKDHQQLYNSKLRVNKQLKKL